MIWFDLVGSISLFEKNGEKNIGGEESRGKDLAGKKNLPDIKPAGKRPSGEKTTGKKDRRGTDRQEKDLAPFLSYTCRG